MTAEIIKPELGKPKTLHELNVFVRDALVQSLPHVLEQLLVAATQNKNLQAKVTAIRALLAIARETGAMEADPMKVLMTEFAEQAEAIKNDQAEREAAKL